MGIMLVQFSRSSLTPQMGGNDGEAMATRAIALGYPKTACLWGDFYPAAADSMQAYGNAWYAGTIAGGADPSAAGGYNEPGVPADLDLEQDYEFHRYWRSGGQVPNVERRGYQFIQLFPCDRKPRADILVDYDVAQSDFEGSYPVAAFKSEQ
jgi:hypothetical protein